MESLLPSSVCSVIRISREKVRQSNNEKQCIPTPSLIRAGSNALCLDKVFTKGGRNFVSQPYRFLVGLEIRLTLVVKSIRAHLLSEG